VDSLVDERTGLNALLAKGLIDRSRVLELDRTALGLRGQIGQADSDIARAGRAIEENNQQIAQLTKDRAAEVSNLLRETSSKLLDVLPQRENARAALARSRVVAPYSGTVVGLNVFSVGGVVQRGGRILDIVPDDTPLIVEAQLRVEDVAEVRPGAAAEVRFTAYEQRLLPIIHGTVTQISADRLTDDRTGAAYYTASVTVERDELAKSPEIKPYAGMPATVMFPTGARSALDYLVSPLVESFDRSFRQR